MQIPLASPAYVLISFDNSLTCDEITLTDEDEDKGGEEDGGFNWRLYVIDDAASAVFLCRIEAEVRRYSHEELRLGDGHGKKMSQQNANADE